MASIAYVDSAKEAMELLAADRKVRQERLEKAGLTGGLKVDPVPARRVT